MSNASANVRPSVLGQSYRFDIILELVAAYGRSVLYLCAIVIYRIDREMQELGNLGAVIDAKTYESKDTYASGELCLVGQNNDIQDATAC